MKYIRVFINHVVLNPIVLVSVALVTGIIGVVVVFDSPAYTARMRRAEQLTPSDVTSLATASLGQEVLLEGRISSRNAKLRHNFAAYVREEYRDEILDGDHLQRWVEVGRETPPLLVTLADGDVRLSNDNYTFDTTPVTVEEAAPTVTKGAVQVRGFTINSPVMIIGQVAEGRAVKAEFLYAGSQSTYIAEMRSLAKRSLPVGLGFLLVSALTSIACIREMRRFLREIAAERLQQEPVFVTTTRKQGRSRRQNG